MPDETHCHRCKRPLSADEIRHVPLFFKLVAGLSLGPVHAGMWLWEDLSKPYCRRCQRWVSILAFLLGVIVLYAGIVAIRWAWKQNFFRT